ncbi:MAG: Putative germination protein GerM, partial [bacterium 42_11]
MRRTERRKYRKRILWGRVIAAVVVLLVTIWGGYHLVGYLLKQKFFFKEEKMLKREEMVKEPLVSERKIEISKKVVYLYLPDSAHENLTEESKEIVESSLEEMIREVFKELYDSKAKVIPQGTELKHVFIGRGIVFLDFSSQIIENHPGGSNAEVMTIYSIVNSLCKSFPEIKMVQFLVDGKVMETLKGHIDISFP